MNNVYENNRALQRIIFTNEFNKFRKILSKQGFNASHIYKDAYLKIEAGIYENLDSYYEKCVVANFKKDELSNNKYNTYLNFMSPLELRLNSIALKNAYTNLCHYEYLRLDTIYKICYEAGLNSSNDILKINKNFLKTLKAEEPLKNSNKIVKKFNNSLKKGTIPTNGIFHTNSPEIKKDLINKNKAMFAYIKDYLVNVLKIESSSERKQLFKEFNLGYYFLDYNIDSSLEISTLLFDKKFSPELITISELKINLSKLYFIKNTLENLKSKKSLKQLSNILNYNGKYLRNKIIEKEQILPEMFSGFYYIYSKGLGQKYINNELENCK